MYFRVNHGWSSFSMKFSIFEDFETSTQSDIISRTPIAEEDICQSGCKSSLRGSQSPTTIQTPQVHSKNCSTSRTSPWWLSDCRSMSMAPSKSLHRFCALFRTIFPPPHNSTRFMTSSPVIIIQPLLLLFFSFRCYSKRKTGKREPPGNFSMKAAKVIAEASPDAICIES